MSVAGHLAAACPVASVTTQKFKISSLSFGLIALSAKSSFWVDKIYPKTKNILLYVSVMQLLKIKNDNKKEIV